MTRLTLGQEARGAELYAAGATERDVAAELGCSASTAHRLRERLDGGTPEPDGQQDGAVDELARQRDDLAARVAALEARAEQARGDDSARFAGRRRQALEEAEDAAESARVLSGEVGPHRAAARRGRRPARAGPAARRAGRRHRRARHGVGGVR